MQKIGLLSDTHGFINIRMFEFFEPCSEIWHAGDIGNLITAKKISDFRPLRAVYGNIDGREIRQLYPKVLNFMAEDVKVIITHIGGYPDHYEYETRKLLQAEKPDLFISGHSHILKVIYDKKLELLHINPGAAGISGFHRSVTMVRFVIEGKNIRDLEVLDIPRNNEDLSANDQMT